MTEGIKQPGTSKPGWRSSPRRKSWYWVQFNSFAMFSNLLLPLYFLATFSVNMTACWDTYTVTDPSIIPSATV